MSATVTSINFTPSLGNLQGILLADHRVPLGARVLELKTCETCGKAFTRERPVRSCTPEGRTLGTRHCIACSRRYLLPPEDADYRDMLPTSAEMAHRSYLPRYDNSMLAGDAPRQGKRRKAWWRELLTREFVKRGILTAKEIGKIIEEPRNPLGRLVNFRYTLVGHVWPREGRGTPAALYALKEDA